MMISNLPADLVEEILYKVPATSLKELRSTCKLWNVIIKENRRFTKKHFHEASKQSVVLMFDDHKVRAMNVAAPSIEFKCELSLKDLEQVHIATVFHCDGLLLCTTKDNRLVVWNPYLGETRWIQLETDHKRDFTTFALGYENNNSGRTYKIMGLLDCNEPSYDGFGYEIYDFSSDSWRVPLGNETSTYSFKSEIGVSLKGNTYWLSYQREYFLHIFDFKRERFKRLPLPERNNSMVVLAVVREEQLSLLYHNYSTSKMEIWMTNNIDTEAELLWRKSFTVAFQDPYDDCQVCMSSLIDEEKKVAVCCIVTTVNFDDSNSEFTVNIIGEEDEYYIEIPNEESLIAAEDVTYCRWPIIFNFVPSLVQI